MDGTVVAQRMQHIAARSRGAEMRSPKEMALSGIPTMTVDRSFAITSFNEAAQRLTGFAAAEALGKQCRELFCRQTPDRPCSLERAMAEGLQTQEEQVEMQSKGLETFACAVSSWPIHGRDGRVIGGAESFAPFAGNAAADAIEALYYLRVGHPQLGRIWEMLPDIAGSEAPVVLVGENGSGKHLLARAIHGLSARSEGPLVRVDCGALGERLLEAELWGDDRSALPNAAAARRSRIRMADTGTIFLHGIERLPAYLQGKLQRFLEDGELVTDGDLYPVSVNARVIASAEVNLRAAVKQGAFREGLFFRLSVFVLEIPPLRTMREWVPALVQRSIERFSQKTGKDIAGISESALRALVGYDFPGNFQELKNVIQYAHTLCKERMISPQDLPQGIFAAQEQPSSRPAKAENGGRIGDVEREVILSVLERNQWNRKEAAQELGIDRTTLWRKMRKMGWGTRLRPA
jgi:PAS domain S-box-containing protein